MIRIAHRRNTLEELRATPTDLGVEVDLRSRGDEVIVHHEPFCEGERFRDWLEAYGHRLLVLNVKEEGLEQRVLSELEVRGITDYFFLDQTFNFLLRTARSGVRGCAVRVSDYESHDTALRMARWVDWVWVDCFHEVSLTAEQASELRAAGLRLCLCSPELHGRSDGEITEVRHRLREEGIVLDAVCTRRLDLWAT